MSLQHNGIGYDPKERHVMDNIKSSFSASVPPRVMPVDDVVVAPAAGTVSAPPVPSYFIVRPTPAVPSDDSTRVELPNEHFTMNKDRKELIVLSPSGNGCYRFELADGEPFSRQRVCLYECNDNTCRLRAQVRYSGINYAKVTVTRVHMHEELPLKAAEIVKMRSKLKRKGASSPKKKTATKRTVRQPNAPRRASIRRSPQPGPSRQNLRASRTTASISRQSSSLRQPEQATFQQRPANDIKHEDSHFGDGDDEVQILGSRHLMKADFFDPRMVKEYRGADEEWIQKSLKMMGIYRNSLSTEEIIEGWNKLAPVDITSDALPTMDTSRNFTSGYHLISYLISGKENNDRNIRETANRYLHDNYKEFGILAGTDFSQIKYDEIVKLMAATDAAIVHFACLAMILKCTIILFDNSINGKRKMVFGAKFDDATLVIGMINGAFFLYNKLQ